MFLYLSSLQFVRIVVMAPFTLSTALAMLRSIRVTQFSSLSTLVDNRWTRSGIPSTTYACLDSRSISSCILDGGQDAGNVGG